MKQQAWLFDADAAATVFNAFLRPDQLLGREATELVQRVRSDPAMRDLLVMIRIDPSDEEAWGEVLDPGSGSDERDVAIARRMMMILGRTCRPALAIRRSPQSLEHQLLAIGWPQADIELALRGRRLASWFERHVPSIAASAREHDGLLSGGWLDHRMSIDMAGRLARDQSALDGSRSEAARTNAKARGLPHEVVEAELLVSLSDLTAMLDQVALGEDLWIVQD